MAANYISVNSVIDKLEFLTKIEDSYFHNVHRNTIITFTRSVVREFITRHTGKVKGLRMTVKEGNYIDLPIDYVKYTRISHITDCGTLIPLAVNTSMSTANSYLSDNLGRILLDNNGVAITGSGDDGISRDCTSYEFDYSSCPSWGYHSYYKGHRNYSDDRYNINPTFKRGVTFKEDDEKGIIQFSGDTLESVVVEYTFDPFKAVGDNLDNLEIHMMFEDALFKRVYSDILNRKSSVPANEKFRAKKDAKQALLEAKIYKLTPAVQDIINTLNLK